MEKIGFIGLGIMGRPMALNLLRSGYTLSVLDLNKDVVREFLDAGAGYMKDGKEIAANSDIIITMLPDSPEVNEVVTGQNGVLQGIRQGSLYIDMSTIAPSTAKNIYHLMQEKGVEALDAPVSGGQVGAETASLSIMVGGNEEAFTRALPVFEAMGKNIVLIGEAGTGQMTKACNQMIVGMTIQAVAEAFTLAKKAGVDLEKMRDVLLGGFAQSKILDLHGRRIIDRNFKPGFKIKLHRKDMNIAMQAGREYSVPLHGTSLVAANFDALIAQGFEESDHSALAVLTGQLSNID